MLRISMIPQALPLTVFLLLIKDCLLCSCRKFELLCSQVKNFERFACGVGSGVWRGRKDYVLEMKNNETTLRLKLTDIKMHLWIHRYIASIRLAVQRGYLLFITHLLERTCIKDLPEWYQSPGWWRWYSEFGEGKDMRIDWEFWWG